MIVFWSFVDISFLSLSSYFYQKYVLIEILIVDAHFSLSLLLTK